MKEKMKFGSCLKILLTTLGINMNQLSKAINVDSSLVSRWINNKRIPSVNASYIDNISEYLSKNIHNTFQMQNLNELFINICEDNELLLEDIKLKIKKVLLESQGYSIECEKNDGSTSKEQISKLLNYYQSDCEETKTEVDSSNKRMFKYTQFIDLSQEDKVVIGNKNVFAASIHLFETAAKKRGKKGDVIYISFINDIGIINDSYTYLVYFRNLVLKVIEKGWNVCFLLRLTNNIDRTIKFMNFAAPLINSGKFSPYYLKKYDMSTASKEIIVVPEAGALFCLPNNPYSKIDNAFYFKNTVAVDIVKNYFNAVLATDAKLLVKFYTRDKAVDYSHCLAESEESPGDRYLYKYSFSILTLPESLYIRLLQKTYLSHNEKFLALQFYKRRLNAFFSNIYNYEYTDIYLADCISTLIKKREFNFYYYKGIETIDLEVKDIIELLQNIIHLLKKYKNYNISFMNLNSEDTVQYINFYCVVKERKAVMLESYIPSKARPEVRLSIEEPMLVKAFEEYFKEIFEHIAPIKKAKNEIINWIQRQINLLNNGNSLL